MSNRKAERILWEFLNAYDESSVTIDEDGQLRTFDKKDIALIRLAIEF